MSHHSCGSFSDDDACTAHLRDKRWGPESGNDSYVPTSGHDYGWWLPTRGLVECRMCHHQTSPTAGTVFHGAPRAACGSGSGLCTRRHTARKALRPWPWPEQIQVLLSDSVGDVAEVARGHASTMPTLCIARTCGNRRDVCRRGGSRVGTGRGVEKKVPVAVAVELDEDKACPGANRVRERGARRRAQFEGLHPGQRGKKGLLPPERTAGGRLPLGRQRPGTDTRQSSRGGWRPGGSRSSPGFTHSLAT